jgi:hypothetical protein
MQKKKEKLYFVYDIRVVKNIFVSYFECSKMNQEKYAFARTSEPWLYLYFNILLRLVFHYDIY